MKMKMKKPKLSSVLTGSLLLVGLLGGCAKDPYSFKSIRNNLSPELASLADRPDDIDRHTAVMSDVNMRAFWDDVVRAWHIDHPTRLSPYPVTYTSGNPR
ncbi:MAG: hypothetical protein ACYSTY_09795 [Planctomycetota bacterium]|jgi:hypothetical protein